MQRLTASCFITLAAFVFNCCSAFAVTDRDIAGCWRDDKELTELCFKPNGAVDWTFVYKGFGDTSISKGHYKIDGDSVIVDVGRGENSFLYAPDKLTFSSKDKTLNLLRGYPVVDRASAQYDTVILTFPASSPPESVVTAMLKLNPTQLVMYPPLDGKRKLAAHIEKGIALDSLKAAQKDKTFSEVKMAGPPGTDRVPQRGMIWFVNDVYDKLMYQGDQQKAPALVASVGGVAEPDSPSIVRFKSNAELLSAALKLSTLDEFSFIAPRVGSESPYILQLQAKEQATPEQIEQSLLKLSPLYIQISKPKGQRTIVISTAGPDSLRRATAQALKDKTFSKVESPSLESKRNWSGSYYIIFADDNFSPPLNTLIVYPESSENPQLFEQALKKLGGEVDRTSSTTLVRFKGSQIISGFLKAIDDPNISRPSQSMRIGGF